MLQGYKLFTVTHRTTDISQIADFIIEAPDDEVLERKLKKIKTYFGIEELMYVNTCNRILFFMYKPEAIEVNAFFFAVNEKLRNMMSGSLNQSIEYYEDELAIHHLYEVASSVDSLVVGEREILRQLRDAYQKCKTKFGITGDKLRIAMQMTVKSAKMVYGKTRIGEKPVSIVSLAIKKLLQESPQPASRVLVIGAGQTNKLMSNFLKKYKFQDVVVFNRTLKNAQHLADRFTGVAYTLETLHSYTKGFDIMVICTGSTEQFLDTSIYTQLLQGDTDQKILVDLSVPSNIEAQVLADNDINYIQIESLKKLAAENLDFRKNEISKVKEILAERVVEFKELYSQRERVRDYSHIPQEIKAVKEKAINIVFKKQLEEVDPKARQLIEEMMSYMEKKCIAVPIKKAKHNQLAD